MWRRSELVLLLSFALLCVGAPASGQETVEDPVTLRAREEFVEGARLSKLARWAEALAAFERSAAQKPHAVTTFNIGACERALGRYTRARAAFHRALAQGELAPSFVEEARTYLREIGQVLVRARLRIEPKTASIAVDGRPLERDAFAEGEPRWVAGLATPGRGKALPSAEIVLLLDPGAHVITLARTGYADAVVNRTFAPGSTPRVVLALDRLPASLRVTANRPGAVVKVDGSDVGVSPVRLTRPAGSYDVVVEKPGFSPYRTSVRLAPGDRSELTARLDPEPTPITARWWFWTGAAAVVVGATVATYLLTRPEPERPPLDGGGLGWTLEVK